jgi:tetratricopeptide (TPR) repeat protein
MQKAIWLLAASLGAQAAHAVDKPVIAPPPAWVKPVAVPAAPAKPDEAAVHILLSDQQVSLEPGKRIIYSHSALKVQTSQGLGVGNISLPWNPETDILTVHKLVIRRGDTLIDILASGQTFTVARREQNMESATLDGVLTANIQPEGLEVGDVLETEFSIETSDPVLRGHVEQAGAAWNLLPVQQAHFSARWPSSMKVATRATAGLPALKPVKQGALTTLDLSLANLEPLPTPNGAPLRYRIGRLVEISDFGSWADAAALEAPLYAKASVIPVKGPLRDELEKIRAASTDPKARTEATLVLVQQRVRYVALLMGIGGLTPADTETSWSRRYGDCKAKTAMLLGLLHELGIQADPVTVSTSYGDGMDQRLPMIALFNHVLVRAQIAGKTYWLDGTRTGDNNLDRIETPYFGWGLPLVPTGATLVRIMPGPLDKPTETASIEIDARQGISLPAPAKATIVLRGDAALSASLGLANLAGEARDRALREYWRGRFDVLEPKTVTASYDAKTGEETLSLEGTAKMDWSKGRYETDGTAIGYRADFTRQPGPDTDAPWLVAFPYYAKLTERVLLPKGFTAGKTQAKDDVNLTVAGVAYLRTTRAADDVVTVERSERSLVPEFPAKDAPAAQKTLRDLADQAIYIQRPVGYRTTDAERDVMLAATPTDARGFLLRGAILATRGDVDGAAQAFDRAIALDPKNADALVGRAGIRMQRGALADAEQDFKAAQAMAPDDDRPIVALAEMASQSGRPQEAIKALTAVLAKNPGNLVAHAVLAQAKSMAGDMDDALEESRTALAGGYNPVNLRLLRANIYRRQGKPDLVAAEAAALEQLPRDDAYPFVAAARLYTTLRRPADATRAFGEALAIKPEAYVYLNRSESRPKSDFAGRAADLDAALKLNPKFVNVMISQGNLQTDQGNPKDAIATYGKAIALSPNDPLPLVGRGIAYIAIGDAAHADRDFVAARGLSMSAGDLNNLCWRKAVAGVALDSALADCDAAVAKSPESATIIDSRAFVLLRLGRLDEAIAGYDKALAKSPTLAASLYGRGIAWARKGDKAKSEADIAAALKYSPSVREEFNDYGVTAASPPAQQVAAAQ